MMSPIANRTAATIASMIRLLHDVTRTAGPPHGGDELNSPFCGPSHVLCRRIDASCWPGCPRTSRNSSGGPGRARTALFRAIHRVIVRTSSTAEDSCLGALLADSFDAARPKGDAAHRK